MVSYTSSAGRFEPALRIIYTEMMMTNVLHHLHHHPVRPHITSSPASCPSPWPLPLQSLCASALCTCFSKTNQVTTTTSLFLMRIAACVQMRVSRCASANFLLHENIFNARAHHSHRNHNTYNYYTLFIVTASAIARKTETKQLHLLNWHIHSPSNPPALPYADAAELEQPLIQVILFGRGY